VKPRQPFELRTSRRHGRGIFARARIRARTAIIEYTGELITHVEGDRRYPSDPDAPEHTFLLTLDDERVIDANVGGNAARYVNHSCDPNVEPIRFGDRMWLVSIRDIRAGEELAYDYAIELDEHHTPAVKARFPCRCGSRRCRGSILRPKRTRTHPLVKATLRALPPSRVRARLVLIGGERF
jgi:SET domain-containing protein